MARSKAIAFTADEFGRIYRMNGKRIPSVTEILPDPGFYCTDEQLAIARMEGIKNHALVESYWENGGETYGIPYLAEYHRFIAENSAALGELVSYEKRYFSNRGFCGKPDTVFTLAIVDLKRSIGNPRYHALQLIGYNILTREEKIHTRTVKHYVLEIGDGCHTAKVVNNRHAESIFLSLLERRKIDAAVEAYLNEL